MPKYSVWLKRAAPEFVAVVVDVSEFANNVRIEQAALDAAGEGGKNLLGWSTHKGVVPEVDVFRDPVEVPAETPVGEHPDADTRLLPTRRVTGVFAYGTFGYGISDVREVPEEPT